MKKNNGITLIALIITIIVLLILSAICLNMVLGNSGIIAKAILAKEKTNIAQEDEEKKLQDLDNIVKNYDTSTRTGNTSAMECIYDNSSFIECSDYSTEYNLSKPFTDFDFIIVYGKALNNTSTGELSSVIIPTIDIELSDTYASNNKLTTKSNSFEVYGGGTRIHFYFPSTTSFKIRLYSI